MLCTALAKNKKKKDPQIFSCPSHKHIKGSVVYSLVSLGGCDRSSGNPFCYNTDQMWTILQKILEKLLFVISGSRATQTSAVLSSLLLSLSSAEYHEGTSWKTDNFYLAERSRKLYAVWQSDDFPEYWNKTCTRRAEISTAADLDICS